MLFVREGALASLLVARAPAVIAPYVDDLLLVAHRDLGVGLLRALRRTFQDLQLEPERRGPPHLPDLPRPAFRPRDLRPALYFFSPLLPGPLAPDRLIPIALPILGVLSKIFH